MLMRWGSQRQQGVTMIESMVVVAIVAIILMIGVPSLQSWFIAAQVSAKTDAILNGLQLARTEAIRRNARVVFSIAADSSWSVGCDVPFDGNGDGDTNDIEDCPASVQAKPAGEGGDVDELTLLPFGASTVTFNGIGAVSANSDGSNSLAQVDISKSGSDLTKTLRVLITAGGQSRICDPEVEAAGDPKKC